MHAGGVSCTGIDGLPYVCLSVSLTALLSRIHQGCLTIVPYEEIDRADSLKTINAGIQHHEGINPSITDLAHNAEYRSLTNALSPPLDRPPSPYRDHTKPLPRPVRRCHGALRAVENGCHGAGVGWVRQAEAGQVLSTPTPAALQRTGLTPNPNPTTGTAALRGRWAPRGPSSMPHLRLIGWRRRRGSRR